MPTELDWVRLAAFIDGEGCIYVPPGGRPVSAPVWIQVTNADPRMPLWCQQVFGGRVYKTVLPLPHRASFTWTTAAKQVEPVLNGCLPHLIVKREQAEIALAYRKSINLSRGLGRRVPRTEVYEERAALKQAMTAQKNRRFDDFNLSPSGREQ